MTLVPLGEAREQTRIPNSEPNPIVAMGVLRRLLNRGLVLVDAKQGRLRPFLVRGEHLAQVAHQLSLRDFLRHIIYSNQGTHGHPYRPHNIYSIHYSDSDVNGVRKLFFQPIIVNIIEVITIMSDKKRPKLLKEGDYVDDPRNSEHWKMFEWVWDKLCVCPYIDNVSDVDFVTGNMGIVSKDGDEYTITLKKKKWREL